MRLQLSVALAVVLAADPRARAQERGTGDGSAASKLHVYQDDDATTVVTSLIDADVLLPARATLGAHALVDVVSTASVDVVAAATSRFRETRIEVGARGSVPLGARADLAGAYTQSVENDWKSHAGQATLALDLAEKNTRLAIGLALVANQVGRAGDPNFTERLQVATIEPSLVQIVNARTMLGIALTFQMSRGFHSSPYRFVRTADGRFSLPEAHPDQRLRASCTGRMLRYLARWLGVELSYRFYGDAWGVLSHTGMLSLRSSFRDAWDVTLRGRGYYQSAAWFWREQYIEPLAYMSADRELSTFYDLGGGMKVAWRRWGWTFDGKADVTFYRFIDFRPLPRRLAIVAGLGAGYEW